MKNISEKNYFYFLYKLTKNLIFLCLSFSIILFLLYFIGNYQNFLDKTQILILKVLSFNSILSFILCFLLIIESISLMLLKYIKTNKFYNILSYFLIILINLFFLIYSSIVIRLSEGM